MERRKGGKGLISSSSIRLEAGESMITEGTGTRIAKEAEEWRMT